MPVLEFWIGSAQRVLFSKMVVKRCFYNQSYCCERKMRAKFDSG